MTTSDESVLKVLIDQLTDTDNIDEDIVEQIVQSSMMAMMVWVIKRATSAEERESLINIAVGRMRHNMVMKFGELHAYKVVPNKDFEERLDRNMESAKKQLRDLLIK